MLVTYILNHVKVADVYDESILNDVLIEEVNSSVRHELREYYNSSPQADLTDILFKVQSSLAMQEGSTKPPHSKNQNARAKQFGKRSWHKKITYLVDTGPTTSPSRSSCRRSESSSVLAVSDLKLSFTRTDILFLPSTLPYLATSVCEVCNDSAHSKLSRPLLSR